MPIYIHKIQEFLRDVEGPQQLRGYIPCHCTDGGTANYRGGANPERYVPMGVSGVTIGTGIDLGQTTSSTLRRIGVDGGVVNALAPYIGQRKADAVTVLHSLPLTVHQDVAHMLDKCMHAHHAELVQARYDKDAGAGMFASLPWQAQAAIFSILFQRGSGSPKSYPNTWKAFVLRDWGDAAARLKSSGLWLDYRPRRKKEGQLIDTIGE